MDVQRKREKVTETERKRQRERDREKETERQKREAEPSFSLVSDYVLHMRYSTVMFLTVANIKVE